MHQDQAQTARSPTGFVLYLFFIVYGSLIPFEYHYLPLSEAITSFSGIRYLELGIERRADLIANFVLYVPLAYLCAYALFGLARKDAGTLVPMAVVIGTCVLTAVAVEFTQLYFAPRTVSLNDLYAEALGAATGFALWRLLSPAIHRALGAVRRRGTRSLHALMIIYLVVYALATLFPFDFLVSPSDFEWKSNSRTYDLLLSLSNCSSPWQCGRHLALEALATLPIGILLGAILPRDYRRRVPLAVGVGLAIGILIETLDLLLASGVSQGASVLSRALGVTLGLAIADGFRPAWIWRLQRYRHAQWLAAVSAAVYVAAAVASGTQDSGDWIGIRAGLERLAEINYLPFYYHYFTSEQEAFSSLIRNGALYAPIGLLCWLWYLPALHMRTGFKLTVVSFFAAVSALLIEAVKLFYTAVHPDPTNILIAVCAAVLSFSLIDWMFGARSIAQASPTAAPAANDHTVTAPSGTGGAFHGLLLWNTALVLAMVAVLAAATPALHEVAVDESRLPKLPAGEELTPVHFEQFRMRHPRLPAPSPDDIAQLQALNPGYFASHRRMAGQGRGKLYSTVLMAYVEPGSQDLVLLHRRLMALKFSWRGNDQVVPLAMAYDWLYDAWTAEQRQQLLHKTVEGCRYIIDVIREQRLSPYNVILYNSPFQALVACAIATYRDTDQAEPVMAFTADLWTNRVVPVWRQVMGEHGGWHEGKEYLGIGIGQAIYQVPAMWRRATGIDYFATIPGIRGFLDFLIYRTRPDGTHFRWGDGGFYNRQAPDRIPLAIEFGHRAAYSFPSSPNALIPTTHPWGPLAQPQLRDDRALASLPLWKYFDGIGMLVARSDWGEDATYVTFKAGDNFWSHSHLDQGTFTIYKRGALAIDSGLNYGGKYGSDHHMNYSYQSIAHNTITVTDPKDTVPAPKGDGKAPRYIANDGGQRRVGSGWGIEPAPLDYAEWERKRAIYHTGDMRQVTFRDGILTATADVTPAYTNRYSGKGTFSHRTRRVEAFHRTFAYDTVDDVVIIFDHVAASDHRFRKRWLLHSIERPVKTDRGFRLEIGPDDRPGHAGGVLDGIVLAPKDHEINLIGGDGFEYFVEYKNFDENGRLAELEQRKVERQRQPAEPGKWRIELSPSHESAEDNFLVVLLPGAVGTTPPHRVTPLEADGLLGCEIVGPHRTTRWWFDPEAQTVRVETRDSGPG